MCFLSGTDKPFWQMLTSAFPWLWLPPVLQRSAVRTRGDVSEEHVFFLSQSGSHNPPGARGKVACLALSLALMTEEIFLPNRRRMCAERCVAADKWENIKSK
jgi:hypothetical protein